MRLHGTRLLKIIKVKKRKKQKVDCYHQVPYGKQFCIKCNKPLKEI